MVKLSQQRTLLSRAGPAPCPWCGTGSRWVNPRLMLDLGGCELGCLSAAVLGSTCTGRCYRGFLPPAPGSKGGLLAVPLCQCCCGEAASIAASLRGGGRLVALSRPGFLFSAVCSLQQLRRCVPTAGSRAGLLAAASSTALARKEHNGPCWQYLCWHFHLGKESLLALALSPAWGRTEGLNGTISQVLLSTFHFREGKIAASVCERRE